MQDGTETVGTGFVPRASSRRETARHNRPVLFVLGTSNETSGDLAGAFSALGVPTVVVEAGDALRILRPGDTALARLDVLQTLDGVEPGLLATLLLERRGVRMINRVSALLAAHDKLRTARIMRVAGIPHPRTAVYGSEEAAFLRPPLVVKPRYGSWGRDVFLCRDRDEVEGTIHALRGRPWFLRHGALVQEYVEVPRRDLRMVVVGDAVVGAATRIAAPGEWRTNVSIGGTLEPVRPSADATALAVEAVRAIGADFMGVDLIPDAAGGHIVLELNAAAEFDNRYSIEGRDVFRELATRLRLLPTPARIAGY